MKLPLLGIRGLWITITVGAAFIGPASSPIGLPDVFWSLQRGLWMMRERRLLDTEPFTTAPLVPGPIVNVQWLADLVFAGLLRLGDLPAVIAGTAVIVAVTYALLLAACITATGQVRLSCIAVWAGYALGATNLSPRPQTLAYPLFALLLLAIARAEWRKDCRLLWWLPLASAFWANVHGSLFTGLVLLGAVAGGHVVAARRLAPALPYLVSLLACGVTSLLNPYGFGALTYVASIGSNVVIRDYVTEWAPTTVLSVHEGIPFFVSLGVVGALLLWSRTRATPAELAVLLAFAWLGMSSVRAVVWWGLAMAPVLARLLGGVLPGRATHPKDRPVVNTCLGLATLCVALVSLPWTKQLLPILPAEKQGVLTPETPVQLGTWLRTHAPPPGGRMFNNQGIGGYLVWAAWPVHQPFVDGRIELHPTQVWLDYLDIVFPSARWKSLLDTYDVSYLVLLETTDSELIAEVRGDPGWRLDYEDELAVVFTRSVMTAAP